MVRLIFGMKTVWCAVCFSPQIARVKTLHVNTLHSTLIKKWKFSLVFGFLICLKAVGTKATTLNTIHKMKFGSVFECYALKYRWKLLVFSWKWSSTEIIGQLRLKVDYFLGFCLLKKMETCLKKPELSGG